jgi:hypothetical protein
MYYSYIEIEYVATIFSPTRTDLAVKLLKAKKHAQIMPKKPDPSVSSGLKVKNATIWVLLDSGSSGDLLFMKKGSSKCISVAKRVVPQS